MKAVILAGGFGSRLGGLTESCPKPMVEIGGKPIIWHIMKNLSFHGITDFVICLGYKGYVIKEYFANYFLHTSDVTFDLRGNHMEVHQNTTEPWKVTLVDTGPHSMTGGRLKRVSSYVQESSFLMTYGDGLANVDISALTRFHQEHGKECTVTAVRPLGRFGALSLSAGQQVIEFIEKPETESAWINGGFFILEPKVLKRIAGDDVVWEREPLESLARDGQMLAYQHTGFWQPMDTPRDKAFLEELIATGTPPWLTPFAATSRN